MSPTQNVSITLTAENATLFTLSAPVKTSGDNYTFTITPKTDKVGTTFVHVIIKDNNNSDTLTNTTDDVFKVSVLSSVNEPPTCDTIPDQLVEKDPYTKKSVEFTGVTDGNGTGQTVTATVSATNLNITIQGLSVSYTASAAKGTIYYYPTNIGTSTVTLRLKDNGGTSLGGVDTKDYKFKILVSPVDLEKNLNRIMIYPNPVTDKLNVVINEGQYETLSIVDVTGRVLITQTIQSSQVEVITSSLAPGLYTLILSGKEGTQIKQFDKLD